MNIFSRTLHTLTAGALAFTLLASVPAVNAAGSAYTDVSPSAWYASPVEYCREHQLMDGMTESTFAPDQLVTRAVLAEALYRLADRPVVSLEGKDYDSGNGSSSGDDAPAQYPFSDVAPDSPYADAILWAWQEGIVSGYNDGTFGPDDPITREQMAVIFWQAQGNKLAMLAAPFADLKEVSRWAIDAVEWVWYVGLMSGKDNNLFDYAGYTTRAEGAAILRAYDLSFINIPDNSDPSGGSIAPNTYDSGAFVVKNGFLTYQGAAPCHVGIDVSSHQKQIDWEQVADAGVEFAMIRAGYRGYYNPTLNKDIYFDYNIQSALANGLDVGVYFFSQAITVEEAQEEAKLLLSWIQDYDITYPVVFDWESVDNEDSRSRDTDGETVTKCAQAFCEIIEQAGYLPMTYGSPSKVYADGILLDQLQDYPFWLAHYTRDWLPTSFRYHYDMWQYSSDGSVPGIDGRVDLNLCLADWDQWD